MKILLTTYQKKILADKSKEDSPNESCALLLGIKKNEKVIVKEVFLTENQKKSSVSFYIPDEQLIQGYNEADKNQMEVVGIFHSHPYSEPYPSSSDKKNMEINDYPWVIFSGITNDFKAYVLESELVEIPIVT